MYDHAEGRQPKHSHYVSTSNNRVYPAIRNLPGYEDDNPNEWRAATFEEIEAYKNGQLAAAAPKGAPIMLDAPVTTAAPSTIQLADDEPPADPPAPAPAVPAAPTTIPVVGGIAVGTSDPSDPPPPPPGIPLPAFGTPTP